MEGMPENAKVVCEFTHDVTVNYAMQQNHVPVVKRLRLTNVSSEKIGRITVSITAEPAFATPCEIQISGLQPGQTVDAGVVDLRLVPTFLASLTERLAGMLSVKVFEAEEILFSQQYPTDILAFDEWGGLSGLPEMIAAFVTPNHPQVIAILQQASSLLQKWSGNSSINGYQSRDPNRVRLQMAAIYSSLQSMSIAYCVPPASFEQQGQKIRTPDALMEHRLGTCLDLAVVYAACIEAAGLNPLIVFTEGHAFAGAWLTEECFSDSVQDDVTLLTKRLAPGVQEVCVLETTALTSDKNCPFEQAVGLGEMNLRDPNRFHFLVDIRRARIGNVRPLPLRVGGRALLTESSEDSSMPPTGSPEAPKLEPVTQVHVPEATRKAELSRLDQWERRLLDLSLRNPLLNFRLTSGSIRLLTPTLAALEDALAEGQDFQVAPRPLDWEETPRDQTVYRRRTNTDPLVQLLNQEFSQRRLRTELSTEELSVRMTRLYRAARTSMEENGANTLYLALGTLVWYETDASQKPRYAPILLIPMDLVRKSVQAGYVLRHGEDEPQLNVTLLEMLRQDFGIDMPELDELPRDTSGVDVSGVLTRVRKRILHMRRWDVLEDAYLGLFSFSKFVMWHDLKMRSKELKRNKLVASLMAGSLQWKPEADSVSDDLDSAYHPKDLLCPLSADSSQLSAICEAERRSTYVLHGPPGTGKSQTITNIIANSIASGRTVLFVAEKMAALTVVQRRLEALGLGPFCLEVHSNKSKKKEVLAKLQRALDAPLDTEPADWEAEANRLAKVRDDLDGYVRALHKKRTSGLSIFQILSRLAALRGAPSAVRFDSGEVSGLTPGRLREWSDLAHQLQVAGSSCGHPYNNVWAHSRLETYSPRIREQCENAASQLLDALKQLRETSAPAFKMFGFPEGQHSYGEFRTLAGLVERFGSTPGIPGTLLSESNWKDTYLLVESWVLHGRERDRLRSRLLRKYREDSLHLNLPELISDLKDADRQWFLPKMIAYRRVKKTAMKTVRQGASLANEELVDELTGLLSLKREEDFISTAAQSAKRLLGRLWNDGNPDWDMVFQALQWVQEVRKLAQAATDSDGENAKILRHLSLMVDSFYEAMTPDGIKCRQMSAFSEAFASFETAWQVFSNLMAVDGGVLTSDPSAPEWLSKTELRVRSWLEATDSLRDWCAWNRTRNQVISAGLSSLVTAYESGKLAGDEVEKAFRRGVLHSLADVEIENEPVLKSFSRVLFEDKIREFRRLDDTYEQLTRRLMYARLASRVPRAWGDVSQNSEMGILGRELQRQRNHMALRNLFQRIPNMLPRLTPCLLMSPMSVAQYLDPAHPPFDLVIFDEASQVPTCDAVGAIARADQAIIVGDPKQLPPTSFFMTASPESDDDGLAPEDLESILDDCMALRMPELRLSWHYRSRHESLIAFSNHQYYNGGLLTFPSPDELTPAVSLRSVQGVYDRSKSRQNRVEAEAVVAEIVRRLLDPVTRHESIGVVTFNQPQQELIEDLLDEQVLEHPEIESSFSPEAIEPVFVKNLENVQGDERDVIIFSVGFGPDALGRITMNFGPLNWSGGQRRLNVAATRARKEMIVYSSLSPDKIDLSRTRAQGVRDLKAFLEYAQRGRQAIVARNSVSSDAEPETLFEEQVCQALRERGHNIHLQVGCSGYRIDLAVVDPSNPGRYLLGIECDGATYHNAKTARDRDKLREAVLKGLGWKLIRIWSTDWWENPEAELKRIEDAITEAQQVKTSGGPQVEDCGEKRQAKLVASPQMPPEQELKIRSELVPDTRVARPQGRIAQDLLQTTDRRPDTSIESRSIGIEYVECHLPPVVALFEEFYLPESRTTIQEQIRQVVNTEGPICFDLLARRVAMAWGMSRIGNRIQEVLMRAIRGMKLKTTRVDKSVFYWPEDSTPSEYEIYRVPKHETGFRRSPEQMPPQEIAAAALEVLRQQISLPEEDLVQQVARLLGYRRTGVAVEQYLSKGIELLRRSGKAVKGKDGKVTLL